MTFMVLLLPVVGENTNHSFVTGLVGDNTDRGQNETLKEE
jgi:hypothetical protein